MCMEDVRIGRQALFTETNVAVGVASALLVAPSPNCYMLMFSPPLAGTVTISTISPVVVGVGFALSVGSAPIILRLLFDGAVVLKQWFAIASGATSIQVGQSVMPLQ